MSNFLLCIPRSGPIQSERRGRSYSNSQDHLPVLSLQRTNRPGPNESHFLHCKTLPFLILFSILSGCSRIYLSKWGQCRWLRSIRTYLHLYSHYVFSAICSKLMDRKFVQLRRVPLPRLLWEILPSISFSMTCPAVNFSRMGCIVYIGGSFLRWQLQSEVPEMRFSLMYKYYWL